MATDCRFIISCRLLIWIWGTQALCWADTDTQMGHTSKIYSKLYTRGLDSGLYDMNWFYSHIRYAPMVDMGDGPLTYVALCCPLPLYNAGGNDAATIKQNDIIVCWHVDQQRQLEWQQHFTS